jgi:hypothetical protein
MAAVSRLRVSPNVALSRRAANEDAQTPRGFVYGDVVRGSQSYAVTGTGWANFVTGLPNFTQSFGPNPK